MLCDWLMGTCLVRTGIERLGFSEGETCGSSRKRVMVPLGFKEILRWRKGSMVMG